MLTPHTEQILAPHAEQVFRHDAKKTSRAMRRKSSDAMKIKNTECAPNIRATKAVEADMFSQTHTCPPEDASFSPLLICAYDKHLSCYFFIHVSCIALMEPIRTKKEGAEAPDTFIFALLRRRHEAEDTRPKNASHTLDAKMTFGRKSAETVLPESFVDSYRHRI